MTPIMQKIEDLRSAITRYNRVTAKRAKPKIGFAYGIILFADDAIEEYCQVLTCWLQEND